MLYIMTFTYIFKDKNFEMWISRKRWELALDNQGWLYIGWYLPSNGTIANAALRDLNLNLQGKIFLVPIFTRNSWKMQTLLLPLDKSGICHRLVPLRILYIMTLTYIFKIINFKCEYIEKRESKRKMLKNDFCRGWYLASNGIIVDVEVRDLDIYFLCNFLVMHLL